MKTLTPEEQLYAGIQLTRPLLRNITARVEADLLGTGISVGQRAILEALLASEKATAPEITQRLQLSRQFVGRELKALSENGLIEVMKNPKHKRSTYYVLNSQSRAAILGIRARESAQIKAFTSRFTPFEVAAFFKIQAALNEEFGSE